MNVLIINLDSKIPNLALKKIEMYHKLQGDSILWDNDIMIPWANKIYVSNIFTFNKEKAKFYTQYNAVIGGTGWDIYKKLPDEIEKLKPKINFGFTTRGCIRNCHFCIVPKKEGKIQVVGDIYDLWDGKSKKITIMDNNIAAEKYHFIEILKQCQNEKIEVDLNQGIDFRLIDEDMIIEMKKTKLTKIRMSIDNSAFIKQFEEKIKLLLKHYYTNKGLLQTCFFVYVFAGIGKGEDFDSCLQRLELLKKYRIKPYLMRHESIKLQPEFIKLAQWCNFPAMFFSCSFNEFKLKGSKKINIEMPKLF
jgi:hypothetical protein